jgi:hypothetical protein
MKNTFQQTPVPLETKALRMRPNTGVPERFLAPDTILCFGEDRRELMSAVGQIIDEPEPQRHEYRCYHCWRYREFTLILGGIGTGAVEPLIKEVADTQVVTRMVLIGTAGYLGDDPSAFGKVYLVEAAYPAGCAVVLGDDALPLGPRFEGIEQLGLPRVTTITTDYYYGFSKKDDPRVKAVQNADLNLRTGVETHWQLGRTIEMETASFYHFAGTYFSDDVQFVAFRGVANLSDRFEDQTRHTRVVLAESFRQAIQLLAIRL